MFNCIKSYFFVGSILIILMLNSPSLLFAQDLNSINKNKFGLYQTSLINCNFFVGVSIDRDWQSPYMLSSGFFIMKKMKRGSKWIFGNSYFFTTYSYNYPKYVMSYCGTSPAEIKIDRVVSKRLNVFNFFAGYQFPSFKGKEKLYIKGLIHYGLIFNKWNLKASPEIVCSENYSENGSNRGKTIMAELLFSSTLRNKENYKALLNYGLIAQVGYEFFQICLEFGIEFNF